MPHLSWKESSRTNAWALAVLLCVFPVMASGAVPDPSRCTVTVSGTTCSHYTFQPDGVANDFIVDVTVRDFNWIPIPFEHVIVHLTAFGFATNPFCVCESDGGDYVQAPPNQANKSSVKEALTDQYGHATLTWSRIGGHGTIAYAASVCTGGTAHQLCLYYGGGVFLAAGTRQYTSSDLDATCDESSTPVNVIDLGIYATGMSTQAWYADYNCDGAVNVLDLAQLAHGMGVNCSTP